MARPFAQDFSWMAPFALAARLKAETGEIEGRGYAGLGLGLGAGLKAYGAEKTRKEERKDDIAREEARFNLNREDRLTQQDFQNQIQAMELEKGAVDSKLQASMALYQVANAEWQKAQDDYDFEGTDEKLVVLKEKLRAKDDALGAVQQNGQRKMAFSGKVTPQTRGICANGRCGMAAPTPIQTEQPSIQTKGPPVSTAPAPSQMPAQMPGPWVHNPSGKPGLPASTPAPLPTGFKKPVIDLSMERAQALSDPDQLIALADGAEAKAQAAAKLGKVAAASSLEAIAGFARSKAAPLIAQRETDRRVKNEADMARTRLAAEFGMTPEEAGLDQMSDQEVLAEAERDDEIKKEFADRRKIEFAAETHAKFARPPGGRPLTPEQRETMIGQMKEWGGFTEGDDALDDAGLREAHRSARTRQTNIAKMDVATITDKIQENDKRLSQLLNPMIMLTLPEAEVQKEIKRIWADNKKLSEARDAKVAGKAVGENVGSLLDYLKTK